ncbi:hypothetical protein A4A49_00715 [Nicotiana attenuata]|uniref:Uncharacterized protein n=1 Tax=Nicotiana attenuata TaxID=49451 RepID=A0A1J6ITU2_NICAT|nr:hypothetical protein A4A49_00715 [Nicotiana attenuata]
MAMGSERSKRLHNFTFGLKWGKQKVMRFIKKNSNGDISAIHRRREPEPSESSCITDDRLEKGVKPSAAAAENGGDEITALREKLMFDLQAEADKMKDESLREGFGQNELC